MSKLLLWKRKLAGLIGTPGVAPFVTSKHAVIGLTKTTPLEAELKCPRYLYSSFPSKSMDDVFIRKRI